MLQKPRQPTPLLDCVQTPLHEQVSLSLAGLQLLVVLFLNQILRP